MRGGRGGWVAEEGGEGEGKLHRWWLAALLRRKWGQFSREVVPRLRAAHIR